MNLKILNEVEYMLQTSPQALRSPAKLKQLINGIFSVEYTVIVRLLTHAITVYRANLPPFGQYKAQSYVA